MVCDIGSALPVQSPRGHRSVQSASRSWGRPCPGDAADPGDLGRRSDCAPCHQIQATGGAHGIRQILGVLALANKHGVAVVEEAAQAALDIGVPSGPFLRKYVERRPPVPLTLRQVDPLIRQLTLYRDLINHKTGVS
jgi:hypothetical protein